MKTLQVFHAGLLVGTRKTENAYTHALVAHSFRAADYAAKWSKAGYDASFIARVAIKRATPWVVSFHSSLDLARKAAGGTRLDWLCCSISIEPVVEKDVKLRARAVRSSVG
jgi:hypothetical protein